MESALQPDETALVLEALHNNCARLANDTRHGFFYKIKLALDSFLTNLLLFDYGAGAVKNGKRQIIDSSHEFEHLNFEAAKLTEVIFDLFPLVLWSYG